MWQNDLLPSIVCCSGEIVSHEVGRDALTANSLGVSERPMLGVLRKTVTLSPSSSPSLHNQYRVGGSLFCSRMQIF